MEALAARIAAFCLQKHYIEPDQIAWLQYGLMRRLMGMVTFLLLLRCCFYLNFKISTSK